MVFTKIIDDDHKKANITIKLDRIFNSHFEQKYQQSIWTKISTTNLNKNIHKEFEQIYQQSVRTEISTNNLEQKYLQSNLINLSNINFEQK